MLPEDCSIVRVSRDRAKITTLFYINCDIRRDKYYNEIISRKLCAHTRTEIFEFYLNLFLFIFKKIFMERYPFVSLIISWLIDRSSSPRGIQQSLVSVLNDILDKAVAVCPRFPPHPCFPRFDS